MDLFKRSSISRLCIAGALVRAAPFRKQAATLLIVSFPSSLHRPKPIVIPPLPMFRPLPFSPRFLPLLLCALALAGCAGTVPLAEGDADAQAKRFGPPAANTGRVYVFEAFAPLSTHNIAVVLDTQIVGQLHKGTFMALDLKPRTYVFTSVGGANNPPLKVEVRAGQTRFLRMKQLFGFGYLGGAEYQPVSEAEGKEEVAARKRVPAQMP